MNNDSEVYTYLGKQDNTYFFIHTINNNEYKDDISYQIYNVLLNDEFIVEIENNVVIYEFNEDNNECNVISIQHTKNNKFIIFNKENLQDFFPILIKAVRKEIYAIEYDYNGENYKSYFIHSNDENLFEGFIIPEEKFLINKVICITNE